MDFEYLNRLRTLEGRLLEDELYRIVGHELDDGYVDTIAQTRALSEGHISEAQMKGAYIRQRVQRLTDELSVAIKSADLEAKKIHEEKKREDFKKISDGLAIAVAWIILGFVGLATSLGLAIAVFVYFIQS